MSKVFVISDTWFNRPIEDDPNLTVLDYNNNIIDEWNDTVSPNDIIYVLGGFGIGDLYHILVRLNGKIHFLDNYFNDNERAFMYEMIGNVFNSADEVLKDRIQLEDRQIITLEDLDCYLSYFPLSDWNGRDTGTFCFHGLDDTFDIDGHSISCAAPKWDWKPVDIKKIEKNIQSFQEKV